MNNGLAGIEKGLKTINTVSKIVKIGDTVKKISILLTAAVIAVNLIAALRTG